MKKEFLIAFAIIATTISVLFAADPSLIRRVPTTATTVSTITVNTITMNVVSNVYIGDTLYSTTVVVTNLNYINGKGNTLVVTNSIKLGDYYVYPILPGTGITFTTNVNPTSGTNVTVNATFTKPKSYLVLASPFSCDGAGAIIYTNDNTKAYFGQAAFSASAATNANYIEYRITVPEDIDTSVDLKVERWKFRLGAADTAAHTYNIGMASVADSASFDSPTIGQWVALSFAGDASGASGDVETVSSVTLTGWRSNMTAGQLLVIRVNRDGTDASTQISYSGPLVISYQ